jgi:hypothetical protein
MPTGSFFHSIEFKTKRQARRFFKAMKKAAKILKNENRKNEVYRRQYSIYTKEELEAIFTAVREQREADEKILQEAKGEKE